MGRKRPFEVRHPWKGKRFSASPRGGPSAGHPKTRNQPVEKQLIIFFVRTLLMEHGASVHSDKTPEKSEGSPTAAPEARFLWNENALEGAVRSIQSDIRFMLRTVPQEKPSGFFGASTVPPFGKLCCSERVLKDIEGIDVEGVGDIRRFFEAINCFADKSGEIMVEREF